MLAPLEPSTLPVGDDMDYLPTPPAGDDVDDELCAMFDESSQCTIVLPEECLGYGLVVPFLACRFALWFRIMKSEVLNSLNSHLRFTRGYLPS